MVEREDGSWLVSGAASADLLADRLGVRHARTTAIIRPSPGFALSVLKHLPETGETFRHDGWSFEIVDMDGRKIDKLIASRPRKKKAEAEVRRGQLERAEPLLEAVDVVAREIIGLLDDAVARDAAAEGAELRVEALDLVGREMRQLLEAVEAQSVQRVGEFRPDALQQAEIVGGVLRARRACGGPGRRAISPVTSLAAAAASPASPRPSRSRRRGMCGRMRRAVGQLDSLARPQQE